MVFGLTTRRTGRKDGWGNAWNRLRYSLWSPVYDLIGDRFLPLRRRSLEMLAVEDGEQVLIAGAGTGADLPLLPRRARVVATDLTPAMLARARHRAGGPLPGLAVMDAGRLAVRDGSVDAVVLHLIVAVMPDPARGLAEVARVLRPGGRAVILDKFLADGQQPSAARRAANVVSRVLFTEINRRLGDILAESRSGLAVERDEPAAFNGLYRCVLLRKPRPRTARSRRR